MGVARPGRGPAPKAKCGVVWKDNDSKWEEYPAVAKELKPAHKDDGCFWVTDTDFFRHFNNVFIVRCSMD